jgi:acyl transferase domain-containing protein/NADPH:quinone reductase-like Zn-dependent oxidoreductase/NADP-dependent 3-hydroxy acid dehydrogenase YdfG/acyl carrier protein
MLVSGDDGITSVPEDRWNIDTFYDPLPNAVGKMYVRAGGFLRQRIDQFDAQFFGMSPREAAYLDPQQRLLLEVAWEALEDAGLVPESLAGSDTGVYIGGFMLDNMLAQFSPLNRDQIGPHSAISSTLSILSNRLSYVFDLRGPSVTMDTACSSSLVALHHACQALWRGECTLALVGGVNVMYRPETLIAMCKGGFLAPDGRCKSFDSRADGYGRGEGAGVVVLKPFAAAVRDGDDICALIRGTGVNQDGHTDGITVPNPESQAALIRRVCAEAGVVPKQVRYVEAHGTGTAVGDPLEASALGTALGEGRGNATALVVGSLKANIGHLEAAAGIASVIKVALCLRHATIPPIANLQTPNPTIPFEALGLRLPLTSEPMPEGIGPAYAAINSFGYGGTNAHALLQEAPRAGAFNLATHEPALCLLPISARRKSALEALAGSYHTLLAAPDAPPLHDVCASAALRRQHHDHRLALIAPSREAMLSLLRDVSAKSAGVGIVAGTAAANGRRPSFVFTGMGPQWWAMGRELLRNEPVFREVAERCDAIFHKLAGWSVLAEMNAEEDASRMSETHIAQPANFILQAGLAALWRAHGVEPAAIVGHSVGEVTAAYVAGVLSLEDAIRVSYHRSRLQKTVAGLGTMLAVGLSEADASLVIAEYGGAVSLAAANSPAASTLAGDATCLAEISGQLQEKGIFNRFLQVEVAYHSPAMDGIQPELLDVLRGLTIRPATVPLYSTVTGERADESAYDAAYWCRNVREPVYFARTMSAMIRDGYRVFLELGPHPVLSTSIKECLIATGVEATSLASLRRGKPEQSSFYEALAGLYVAGCPIDWQWLVAGSQFVRLPAYPWQRETHWQEAEAARVDRVGRADHALLGRHATAPQQAWQSRLNPNLVPYLPDHQVQGLVVLPGAAYVELGLAVHSEISGGAMGVLENLRFHKALVIEPSAQPQLHTSYDPDTRGYTVHSRAHDGVAWQLHATGQLSLLPRPKAPAVELAELQARCSHHVDHDAHYVDMQRRGLQYGPHFQGLQNLWYAADRHEILALIECRVPTVDVEKPDRLPPPLLDACFQSMIAMAGDEGDVYVPVRLREVRLHRTPTGQFWCHGRRTRCENGLLEGDVTLFDATGDVLVELRGVQAQALSQAGSDRAEQIDQWLYQFARHEATEPVSPVESRGRWLIFADRSGVSEQLVQRLRNASAEVISVRPGPVYGQNATGEWLMRAECAGDFVRLMNEALTEPVEQIVYLWGLDAIAGTDPIGISRLTPALHLIQALARVDASRAPRLAIVTCRAQPMGREALSEMGVAQAPVVGLTRVAANECTGLRCRLIDIDTDDATLSALEDELLSDSDEDDVALRGAARHVNRLVRRSVQELGGSVGAVTPRRAPQVDEIECALRLAPLGENAKLDAGAIGYATVVRVGSSVVGPKLLDTVLVPLQGTVSPFITLPATHAFPLPSTIHEEQTAVLGAFVGAEYALRHIGRLEHGEHVLVHAAHRPFGMAAVATARRFGATIYATAEGSDAQAHLRTLGATHVFDANSGVFADEIMHLTNGRGVDVALNVAVGEIAARTLSVLAPFGRFLHVPGRFEQRLDGLVAPHANQSIATIDLHELIEKRPALFARLLANVYEHVPAHDITSVPLQLVSSAELAEAGPPPSMGARMVSIPSEAAQAATGQDGFRTDATYLVTGGFGGFGLKVAEWLVSSGAGNLVLVGRRGAADENAQEAVERLRRAGANVLPVAADIAEEAQVQRLLAEIVETMPPLRGVFHAAAVLDDSPISTVTRARLQTVLRPKALGAWHLHRHTRTTPLDHFVLFSSIGSLVGNPGQAAYVAANAFLDALAEHRRSLDLPAISINWGALAEVGMAARHEGVEAHLNRVGVGFFRPKQAIALLDKIVRWRPTTLGVAIMDWRVWGEAWPAWAASPRYRHLTPQGDATELSDERDILRRLREMEPGERHAEIEAGMFEAVAAIVRLAPDTIDPSHSLLNIGVDSLMAMEIQAAIERRLGIKVSTLELMKGDSLAQLVQRLGQAIDAEVPDAATTPAGNSSGGMVIDAGRRLVNEVTALSDAEVTRALEQLLEDGRKAA